MMWHFYEIPYIPDLELVKYQSLGEQGIDGILERHNRFLRQWQRNTVLIHTTLHFFLSYTHERPKGSRLQIFLAFSSDQTVNFESIDALMQASPLADYYKIAPIEDVPVCLRKTSVYKGYKQDKIEMRGDRAEMSDFPLYLNTVAGGLDRRDQTIGGFSFVVKIYAVPVVEIIG